jgi:hypothetical protein
MAPNDHLADQLQSAYDCYLDIHRHLKRLRSQTLQRTSEDEVSALLCPPCFYRIKGEAQLLPSFLTSMDGNNLLKLVNSSYQYGNTRADDRLLPSPGWLEPDEVNMFENAVRDLEHHKRVNILP